MDKRLAILFQAAVVFMAVAFSSCRTTREIPGTVTKPISTNKLLKKIEQNAFDYQYLTIRRINCQFSDNETKANFRISLKAQKNEKILVSISKLQVPVGRVLLTPDSVKYVNYIEQNYFVDDYTYLSKILNIEFDFASIESVIGNNIFSFAGMPGNKTIKSFDAQVEEGKYVLKTGEKQDNTYQEESLKPRMEKRLKRFEEESEVLLKLFFNPQDFSLSKVMITDENNKQKMELNFDDFTNVNKKHYPTKVEMLFESPENIVNLRLKMSGFSTEEINSLGITIPAKYQQIHVN